MNCDIVLSICIPTYRGGKFLIKTVESILECKSEKLEVCIFYDISEDNSLKLLKNINDGRIKIIINKERKGLTFSLVKSLCHGTGKYLMLSTDKETINPQKLWNVINFLETNNPGGGICWRKNIDCEDGTEIFPSGYPALRNIPYRCLHPTGNFFRRDVFLQKQIGKKYCIQQKVGNFPLEFALADFSCEHDMVRFQFNISEGLPDLSNENMIEQSRSTLPQNDYKQWFTPYGCFYTMIRFTKHAMQKSIKNDQKAELLKAIFSRFLCAATLTFKDTMDNKEICAHYYMETRHITNSELIEINLHFSSLYLKFIWRQKKLEKETKRTLTKEILKSGLDNLKSINQNAENV